jgi:hypothetical protein
MKWIGVLVLAAAVAPAAQGKDTAASRAGFMVGCWEITGPRHARETWYKAADEFLMGQATTVAGGKVVEFEYTRVQSKDGVVTFTAQPGGTPPTVFTMDPKSGTDEAIFVNMAHDFPKRVVYKRTAPDALLAWIDGGEGTKKIEFPYRACK